MTRAEERALEAYPKSGNYTSSQRLIINDMRDGFIQGYEQAKKDVKDALLEWANRELDRRRNTGDEYFYPTIVALEDLIEKLNSL